MKSICPPALDPGFLEEHYKNKIMLVALMN